MARDITFTAPEAGARRLLELARKHSRQTSSATAKRDLKPVIEALAAALDPEAGRPSGAAARLVCHRCSGSRLVRNPAWALFQATPAPDVSTAAEIEDLRPYDYHAEKRAYAAQHGPELIACPACADRFAGHPTRRAAK